MFSLVNVGFQKTSIPSPMEGSWKFQGGGGGGGGGVGEGAQKPKFLKESMKLNWNFQRGGAGSPNQKPLVGGIWDIFWNNKLV